MIYNTELVGISGLHLNKLSGLTMEVGGLLNLTSGGNGCSFMFKFTCRKSKSKETLTHIEDLVRTFNRLFNTRMWCARALGIPNKESIYNGYEECFMWIVVDDIDEGTIKSICNMVSDNERYR